MNLAVNKKAGFDYELLERLEAGMILKGYEVKSVRAGGAKLSGAYVLLRGDKLWLIGAHIGRFKPAGAISYDPERARELLLRKKEIKYLQGKFAEKRLTFIPLRMYTKSGKIKLEFAIARHKKKYEKREQIKKRDVARTIRGALRRS